MEDLVQPGPDVASRQRLRRGLRGCLGSGMREGGALWVKVEGETEAVGGEEERDDAEETAEEASPSTSSSPHDLLVLGKGGVEGGERAWRPSPTEEERLLLAMELAVGFM